MFNKIPHKEIVEFTRVLSLLLYSRVSIIQAMELILKQTKNEKLKEIVKNILKEIKGGSSLSKSFAKYPDVFADIFIANLKVGEETGEIAEVIGEYSLYMQKMQSLKGKILQAIRYPVMVLIVALGVVVFMLVFIIPTSKFIIPCSVFDIQLLCFQHYPTSFLTTPLQRTPKDGLQVKNKVPLGTEC
jgi:type IV pilus assembly protein PilC